MENNNTQNKIQKIKIGITHGDINGISYEIILKAFKDPRMLEFFTPVIYGSPKVAAYYKKVLKLSQVQLNHIKNIDKADPQAVNIINCVDNKVRVEIGVPTEISGKAAIDALNAAVADLKAGKLDAIVTAPISKQAVYGENFEFKGHTWYFAKQFEVDDVLMLMVYEDLRIAVATDHIPLRQVPEVLTSDLLLRKIELMDKSLRTDFSIEKPVIAVLSLNPHAGDNGLIGDEEEKIIKPAIQAAKDKGLMVIGPYPADGFFSSGNYRNFDGILALYHDQGMVPFKILSMGKGVNFTAGLPIIRTSPAHGTAYDIAGLNQADPTSFVNALFLARTVYKNRKRLEGITPLEKQDMEELLPTLMPAKAAELEEMQSIQQEDEQDNIQQEQPIQAEPVGQTAPEEQETREAVRQPVSEQSGEQPAETEEAGEEKHEENVIAGDHPDVEVETVDEEEARPEDNGEPEHTEEKHHKTGFNKLKERFQQHKQHKTRHQGEKKHERRFGKFNPRDYRDLT